MSDPLGAHVLVRSLQDDNSQNRTNAPTASPTEASSNVKDDLMAYEKYSIVVLVLVALISLFCMWRSCRRRRERRALDQISARADSALGDLAMVPRDDTDDEDEHGELI